MLEPLVEQAQQRRDQQTQHQTRVTDLQLLVGSADATQHAVIESMKHLITFLDDHTSKTEVVNHPSAVEMANVAQLTDRLEALNASTQANELTPVIQAIKDLATQIDQLPKQFPDLPEAAETVTVSNMVDPTVEIQAVTKAIRELKLDPVISPKFDPQIEVKPADVHVAPTDLTPIQDTLQSLLIAFQAFKVPDTNVDLKPVVKAVAAVQKSIDSLVFPIPNYVLPFKNAAGAATQATVDGAGSVITAGLIGSSYDTINVAYPGPTQEIYTFLLGGNTVATVTVDYSNSTKAQLTSVVRT